MSVNQVSNSYTPSTTVTANTASQSTASQSTSAQSTDKKEAAGASSGPASVFTKTNPKIDKEAVDKILKESNKVTEDAFKKLVSNMLNKQAEKSLFAGQSGKSLLEAIKNGSFEVDEATRTEAQELVSEDGYFGVKATSERLLSFAKAYAGSDGEKMQTMLDSFKAGFKQAEKMWGGELPEISQQTYDAVIKGFEEMSANTGIELKY